MDGERQLDPWMLDAAWGWLEQHLFTDLISLGQRGAGWSSTYSRV